MRDRNQRFFAAIIGFGACILTYRTVRMAFIEDALRTSTWWVLLLLFIEMAVDLACIGASIRWFASGRRFHDLLPLRLAAAATLLHAVRVIIYVAGRTALAFNFDIRPEYRNAEPVDWFWVYFAAVLAVLGVLVVITVWLIRRRNRRFGTTETPE